jgi:hypothetical protein
MSARPATAETDALGLGGDQRHGVVESQRAVEQAALDLAAVGHLAQRGGVDGGLDLGIDGFDRREDRHLGFGVPMMCARSMAFWMMSTFSSSVGSDVDRRVGDHHRARVGRHVHQEDVADAALGAQAGAAGDDLGHQFVGVQAALHQGFGVAAADQRHRHRRRFVAVPDVHDAVVLEVEAVFFGDGADALLGPIRIGSIRLASAASRAPLQRFAVAGVHHGHVDRRQAFGTFDTRVCRRAYLSEMVISGIDGALGDDLFARRQHLGAARDHEQLILIDAGAVEHDVLVVANFCLTVTVTVSVSPIATGRAKCSDDSTITVPGPGNCVPSMVDSSEAHHMPCAMKSWKTPL